MAGGDRLGGPAPRGLYRFRVTGVTGTHVEIGEVEENVLLFVDQEPGVRREPEGFVSFRFRYGVFEIAGAGDSRRRQDVIFARFFEGGRTWLITS